MKKVLLWCLSFFIGFSLLSFGSAATIEEEFARSLLDALGGEDASTVSTSEGTRSVSMDKKEKFYRSMVRVATLNDVKKEICSMGYQYVGKVHFRDADTSTPTGRAIQKMGDYCIVHGYGNNGVYYGLNNVLTKGEAYKIFVRMLAIDHSRYDATDAHWALPFFGVGRLLGLRSGVTDAGQFDEPIMLDDFVHIVEKIARAMNRISHKDYAPIDYSALKGKVIRRGAVAEIVTYLMDKVYDVSMDEIEDEDKIKNELQDAIKEKDEESDVEDHDIHQLTVDKVKSATHDITVKGKENAKLLIIEYADLECDDCKQYHKDGFVNKILDDYADDVKYVFKNFPLSDHKDAEIAAHAVECAKDKVTRENAYKYIDELFKAKDVSKSGVIKVASTLRFYLPPFEECLDESSIAQKVKDQKKEAKDVFDVKDIPTHVVLDTYSGKYIILKQSLSYKSLQRAVHQLLHK